MAEITHCFERCVYMLTRTSTWLPGIAKVHEFGLSTVMFILDMNGEKVSGNVYDYRLTGPTYTEQTSITLHEMVADAAGVPLPYPYAEHPYGCGPIPVEDHEKLRKINALQGKIFAVKRLREMTGLGISEAKNVIETWFER